MARQDKPYPFPSLAFDNGGDWRETFKQQDEALAKLQEASNKLDPEGKLTGALVRFPVADGYAFYVVTKDRPLTLAWIDYGDGYAIPDAHLRGLRAEDVRNQLRFERAWAKGESA